jgi:hypothetical protein
MLHKLLVFILVGALGLIPVVLTESTDDPDRGPMIDPDGLSAEGGPMIDPTGLSTASNND